MAYGNRLRALIAAPSIFAPANISAPMAEKVARVYSLKGGYEIDLLMGPLATRIPIMERLKEPHSLVIYMGHGRDDRICGENPFCDGITVKDAYLFQGKIVVAAPACEVGQLLAPTSVYEGTKAFIAATTSMYGAWNEAEHNYYADWRVYFETLYKYLMAGTVGEALQAYRDKATEFIDLYKSKEDEWPNADWYINATYNNRDRLQVFGDASARVSEIAPTNLGNQNETIEDLLNWISPPLI